MSARLFDLSGKVALVTGAGARGGLGHAMAIGLAEAGADVAVSDIDAEGAAETRREIEGLGRRGSAITCDNARREHIGALFAALDRDFGRIDVLVNNVGAGARTRPEDLSYDDWQRIIGISLTGTFLCCVEAGRRMMAQGGGGSIVNISSTCGSSGMGRGNFAHSIAKSGVNEMTRELAVEWAPHGIRVNAIQPAQIRTAGWNTIEATTGWDYPLFEQHLLKGIPLGRLGEPADLVGPAVFLASSASGFITGHLLAVDGGNLALNAAGSIVWPAMRQEAEASAGGGR
jgi:NAD(P)-dependent dehydrogenase (short-subunit alcohol dehydrogenase family)